MKFRNPFRNMDLRIKYAILRIRGSLSRWGTKKIVIVSAISLVVTVSLIVGAVALCKKTATIAKKPKETQQKTAVVKKDKPKETKIVTKTDAGIPVYSPVAVAGDSIEKDLTLYITDSQGKKVKGIGFKVKLAQPQNADKLNADVNDISAVNKAIATAAADGTGAATYDSEVFKKILTTAGHKGELTNLKTQQETIGLTKVKSDKKTKLSSVLGITAKAAEIQKSDGTPLTNNDMLLLQKQQDISKYATALNSVKGDVYTDDNSDGIIYIKQHDPGKFKACFVPLDSYDAKSYLNDVDIKDKIEYKPVKNIKQKVVANAGDTKPAEAAPVEAVLTDTVGYVDSRTDKHDVINKNGVPQTLKSSVSGTNVTLYSSSDPAASTATISNINKPNYTATVKSDNEAIAKATLSSDGTSVVVTAVPNTAGGKANITISYTGAGTPSASVKKHGRIGFWATITNFFNPISVHAATLDQSGMPPVVYTVTVNGSSTPVMANDEKTPIYSDATATKEVTTGDYTPGTTYYTKTTENKYYGWQIGSKDNGLQIGSRYYFDQNGNKVTGTQVIRGAKYNFGSDGTLLTSGMGIDVSKWQGNIDWSKAKSAISFAIIRAGYRGSTGGLSKDPYYERNMKNAKANGVKVGIYFYSIATTEAEAVEEASLAVALAQDQGGVSLPIYMDVEGSMLHQSNDQLNAEIRAFCSTVQGAGYRAGLYSSRNPLTKQIDTASMISSGISIWCAQYNTSCTLANHYDIWQYTSKGSVPGISGNVDMNQSYF